MRRGAALVRLQRGSGGASSGNHYRQSVRGVCASSEFSVSGLLVSVWTVPH